MIARQALCRLLAAAVLTGSALPAPAQSVRVLGEYTAWSAYATAQSVGQICFMLSRPTASEPRQDGSDSYFYITHRPSEGVRSEISLVAGYVFAPQGAARLIVGADSFALVTEGDGAWLADPAQAETVVAAIRAGATMTVEALAASGQMVRQTFSLIGATAAGRAIAEAC